MYTNIKEGKHKINIIIQKITTYYDNQENLNNNIRKSEYKINRIIQKIAAYYDDQGNLNNTIDQAISDALYNEHFQISNKLNIIDGRLITKCIAAYEYESISKGNNAAIYGITINKNNIEYILEWHVKKLKETSIIEARQRLDDIFSNTIYNLTIAQQEDLNNTLENEIINHFYRAELLIFKNRKNTISKSRYYSQDYTINQLKQIGKRYIQQYIKIL